MKYLKKFNEAIVDWETDNIKEFYKELKDKYKEIESTSKKLSFDEIKEVADVYDVEVVKYKQFHEELPTDQMRKDAPPSNARYFALVNPVTKKARLVINVDAIDEGSFDFIYHMLKHENVHVGQVTRKGDDHKDKGEFMGDVRDTKAYFSNKDEIMAFAQSVSDMVMDENPENMEEAVKLITKTPLWRPIKSVDEKTLKRYKKYIYLYLEREFEKRN